MKKIICILFSFSITILLNAQTGIVNDASYIKIGDDAHIKIQGANGHYINKNDGKIKLDGILQLAGDWGNLNSSANIWMDNSEGNVEFTGSSLQTIYENTHFKNLYVKNASGVLIDDALEVDNLFISDGVFNAGGNNILIYGNWDSENGVFIPENNHVYFLGDYNQVLKTSNGQIFHNITLDNNNKLFFDNSVNITNVYITSGTGESLSNVDINSMLVYNGSALQTTGDEWPNISSFDIFIENTSVEGVLLSANKQVNAGKTLKLDGVFDMGNHLLSGSGNLVLSPGATLATSHTNGLNGNITLSGTVTLDAAANFKYNGNLVQETGSLLPDHINTLNIHNSAGDVLLSNTGLLTITGNYSADEGRLVINPQSQLTVNGITSLNNNYGLVLKSDITGTASFIDNGVVSGNALVETYLRDEIDDFGRYLSTPISDAHSDLFQSPDAIYVYNSSISDWEIFMGGYLDVMKGYVVKYPAEQSLEFHGTLNTGEQSRVDLIRTFTPNNFGWNLIGNPYPSAFDWDFAELDNMNTAVYYKHANGSISSYVNYVGNPQGTTSIIPSMQSFWIQVNINHSLGSVLFNNSGRVHDDLPLYKSTVVHELIRLKADNGFATDEAVVYFASDALPTFDYHLDAVKKHSNNPSHPAIFSYSSCMEKLSINAIPYIWGPILVPIAYKSQPEGDHLITAFDFDEICSSISIHLEDLKLNNIQDLRQNNEYAFSHQSDNSTDRFILHFNYTTHIDEESPLTKDEIINIYAYEQNLYINFSTNSYDVYDIEVVNMLGQTVYKERCDAQQKLRKINLNVSSGNYLVKVSSLSNNHVEKINIRR